MISNNSLTFVNIAQQSTALWSSSFIIIILHHVTVCVLYQILHKKPYRTPSIDENVRWWGEETLSSWWVFALGVMTIHRSMASFWARSETRCDQWEWYGRLQHSRTVKECLWVKWMLAEGIWSRRNGCFGPFWSGTWVWELTPKHVVSRGWRSSEITV